MSAKRLVAGDSVLFIWYAAYYNVLPFIVWMFLEENPDMIHFLFFFFFLYSLGMKRISYFWASGVLIGRKQSCLLLFYQVIACI